MIKTVIRASLVLALVVGLSACGSKAPRPVSELALTDAALQNAEVAPQPCSRAPAFRLEEPPLASMEQPRKIPRDSQKKIELLPHDPHRPALI